MAGWPRALEGLGIVGVDPGFWRGRRVLLTGHTGFKGAWCALWLHRMGAHVTGLALPPDTRPSLFAGAGIESIIASRFVDLREPEAVGRIVTDADPEIVLHLAAQALVRRAFESPVETFATNVLGTVHLLDALRSAPSLRAVLVVTSDKVYRNDDSGTPFREDDPLGGSEPYGASKAAAEIATRAMAAYFAMQDVRIATVRGGNVIGGGDYAPDRLVPDIVRAVQEGRPVALRHPGSTRPWQHVLDCLAGYLAYAQALAEGCPLPKALNIGPGDGPPVPVSELAEAMLTALGSAAGWRHDDRPQPREARALALDSSRARTILGWRDLWSGQDAVDATASWFQAVREGIPMRIASERQIKAFEAGESPRGSGPVRPA